MRTLKTLYANFETVISDQNLNTLLKFRPTGQLIKSVTSLILKKASTSLRFLQKAPTKKDLNCDDMLSLEFVSHDKQLMVTQMGPRDYTDHFLHITKYFHK